MSTTGMGGWASTEIKETTERFVEANESVIEQFALLLMAERTIKEAEIDQFVAKGTLRG